MKTLLVIGINYPEPDTTAAGGRMMQLFSIFKEQEYQIIFASNASISERSADLDTLGIETRSILLNDNSFDTFIKELDPDVVLFDRFITEEQFGWRVSEHCPDAMRILDTEDLHFLRKAREDAVKNGIQVEEAYLFSEATKREIASIYRCDLSLIISEAEMALLQGAFSIKRELIYYLPMVIDDLKSEEIDSLPPFEKREGFMTIGNFLHAPNVDSIQYLQKEIWPLIRKELPEARMNVYGAYSSEYLQQLHDDKNGFYLKGWAENVNEVMRSSRVCLAPLRFGAGLKGKIIDAMKNGTPTVTTHIGAEGIHSEMPFSGLISNTSEEFAKASIELYTNKDFWERAQQNGFDILEKRFKRELFYEGFKDHIQLLSNDLLEHREKNFIGQILHHHTLKSSMYMSKWIEEKNK